MTKYIFETCPSCKSVFAADIGIFWVCCPYCTWPVSSALPVKKKTSRAKCPAHKERIGYMYYTRFDDIHDKELYIKQMKRLDLPKYAIGYFFEKTWYSIAFANEKPFAELILVTLLQTTTVRDIDIFHSHSLDTSFYDLRIIPPDYDPQDVIE